MPDLSNFLKFPQSPVSETKGDFGGDAPEGQPIVDILDLLETGGSERARTTAKAIDILSFGETEATFGEGFLTGLSEGLLNNAANLPAVPGRLVGAAIEGIGKLTGNDLHDFAKMFDIGPYLPSATDIKAAEITRQGAQHALLTGQAPDIANRFRRAQMEQETQSDRIRSEAPFGTNLGELAGDALSIAGVRSPIAVGMGKRAALAEKATQVAQSQARVTLPSIAKNVATSKAVRGMLRAAGHAGEAGLEGAFLATLKSGDPIDIMSVSAGSALGQLGGTAALPFLPKSKKGFAGLALAVAGLTTAFRLGQNFSPGQNNVFDAMDQSFEKLAIGIATGVAATAAGANRIRPRNSSAIVSIMLDSLNAVPRGAIISIWDEALRDQDRGRSVIENGLAALAADPGGFTDKEMSAITRALKDPKVSLSETFERLGIGNTKQE